MLEDLKAFAANVTAAAAGLQRIGAVRIWGLQQFRPGDVFYKLGSASAASGVLKLDLIDLQDGKRWTLEVRGASNASVKPGELRIGSAESVSHGGSAVVKVGDGLEVRGDDGSKTTRKLSKQPALLITSD